MRALGQVPGAGRAGRGRGQPLDGAPLQQSQQRPRRLKRRMKKKKGKTKPKMPKEFQWDEVPPPLREYLGKRKQRYKSK